MKDYLGFFFTTSNISLTVGPSPFLASGTLGVRIGKRAGVEDRDEDFECSFIEV